MLHVKPCLGQEAENLLQKYFGKSLPVGVDVGLYNGETLVGAARVDFVGEAAVLCAVCVDEPYRHNGYGDFLTRATIDAYTRRLPEFRVGYVADYYLQFGFTVQGEQMCINSADVKFPSLCKGNRH